MLSQPATTASGNAAQKVITGWLRPSGGYPDLILASSTEVTIPAGTGVIVTPEGAVTVISWGASTLDLSTYLANHLRTWLLIDDTGTPVIVSDYPDAETYRANILLGYAIHLDGATITEAL